MRHTSHNRGFTIIETLVAITVLMIAVAGPLSVAGKGLTAALAARDQMTASFLAQESMEIIKNLRNNNVPTIGFRNWIQQPGIGTLAGCVKDSQECDASAIQGEGFTQCSGGQCRIYSEPTGYGHNPDAGTATIFSRSFYLTSAANDDACQTSNDDLTECRVTVHVTWREGSVQDEVTLTSQLSNGLISE